MTVKQIAHHTIDTLPSKVTMDDIMYALYVRNKFQHGQDQIKQGKGIPHEQAKKMLSKLRVVCLN